MSAVNTLVTASWVIKKVTQRLTNALRFTSNVNRGYDDQYVVAGAKVGYTVNARLPQRYQTNKGAGLSPVGVSEEVVPISLTDQANIGIEFSSASLKMEVDNYAERYIDPAVEAIANTVDYDGLSRMYKKTFRTVGTPAVVPATNSVYLDAGVKLSEGAVPTNRLVAMLTSQMHATIANANLALFNPSAAISKQYRTGMFGNDVLGIKEWYKDENIATHVVGALGGTPQMNGTTVSGATSIVTNGWTSAAAVRLKEGDVIQIGGVFEINPMSYQSTGRLKDFVVTADTASDSSGNMTIPIYPAVIAGTAYATADAVPLTGAAITIFGHASSHANKVSRQGLVYDPNAYTCVMADLPLPQGVWVSKRISNKALGVSVRFIKAYDVMSDQSPARLDVLYGWAAVRPEMSCRVCS
ncbi:MAG: P22 phage major capsid protein family protein [Thermoplasmatota archaeon]